MRRFLLTLILVFACAQAMALSFPALTGRVVDAAHILSPATVQDLEQTLATYEQQSTNQLVVATIPSLEGGTIEDYGYQLGRQWGIGQKGKNNGVLLIVAPHEHKVRIEVGYGLEGTLTDAQSSQIIQSVILPDFRRGQMELGIVEGTRQIILTLGGQPMAVGTQAAVHQGGGATNNFQLVWVIFIIVFVILRIAILPWWFPTIFPFSSGGSFGGGGFGGGFSGGGGSFGGGGASGGW